MKKAILVVSFGTTYADTRKLTIDRIEERVRESFKDYEVTRAFTAHKIISVLNTRDGIKVDTPEEAFEKLAKEGYEEVIVQPLHIIPGEEFEYVMKVAEGYKKYFKDLKCGRPILFFKGGENQLPDDYEVLVEAIEEIIPVYFSIKSFIQRTDSFENSPYATVVFESPYGGEVITKSIDLSSK